MNCNICNDQHCNDTCIPVDFKTLSIDEQRTLISGIFSALECLWGENCLAGIEAGDNRQYNLANIADRSEEHTSELQSLT
jgi:hypothetical protein